MKKRDIKVISKKSISTLLTLSLLTSMCFMNKESALVQAEEINKIPHHHTFACYENYWLDCDEHKEGEHRIECYNYSGDLVCGLEEGESHYHESCSIAAKVLVCDKEDSEEENVPLIATPSQVEVSHKHNSDCYELIYKCRVAKAMSLREITNEIDVSSEEELVNALSIESEDTLEIRIVSDFHIANTINIDKSVNIDLNGHNIVYDRTQYLFNIQSGELGIRDTTVDDYYNISSEEVEDIEEVEYKDDTKELVYYASEGNIENGSIIRKNTKYTVDLSNIENCGKLEANGAKAIINITSGNLNVYGGHITNKNGDNGIYLNGGKVFVHNGYFTDCGNNNQSGGAIFSNTSGGDICIYDGVFLRNKAKQGGALRTQSGFGMYVDGGIFALNEALYNGGAIYGNDTTRVINTILVGNKSNEGGGALYSFMLQAGTGKFNVENCEFYGNKSLKTGGAIELWHQGNSNEDNYINGTKISNNESVNGGGIYIGDSKINIDNSGIEFNKASQDGGGVYYDSEELNILDGVRILGNSSSDDLTKSVYGLNNEGINLSENCLIEHNWLESENVEVGTFEKLKQAIDNTSRYGRKEITLTNDIDMESSVNISNNREITLLLNGHTINGENISEDYLFKVTGQTGRLKIKNTSDEEVGKLNIIETLMGETDSYNSGKESIYDEATNEIVYYITKSEIESDKVHTKESLYEHKIKIDDNIGKIVGNGRDSILYADLGGSIIIENGVVHNKDGNHGIYAMNGASVEIKGGYILGNGRGLDNKPDTEVNDNFSIPDAGAGIYCGDDTRLKISGGVIGYNHSVKSGGGVCSRYSESCEIVGGVIVGNSANNFGGGISTIRVKNKVIIGDEKQNSLIISGNVAHSMQRPVIEDTEIRLTRRYGGGGIFTDTDTIIKGGYITHNTCTGEAIKLSSGVDDSGGTGGGGIFASDKLEIVDGFITSNKAHASGGGIYSYSGKWDDMGKLKGDIKLHGGIIASNQAIKGEAGGV